MEDNEKKENIETTNTQAVDQEPAAQPVTPTTPDPRDDEEDDVATAEEMAEYVRQSAERRAQKKAKKAQDDEESSDYAQADSEEMQEDPYLEPDPTLPWAKY